MPISGWWAAILAFLAGLLGVFSELAGRQKDRLEEAFKKTMPEVDARLARAPDGSFVLVIVPLNGIPFECDPKVVTKSNVMVSPIGLEWMKIVPQEGVTYHHGKIDVDLSKVQDGYIELRLPFRSTFASEFPNLSLSGRVVRSYQLQLNGELVSTEDS